MVAAEEERHGAVARPRCGGVADQFDVAGTLVERKIAGIVDESPRPRPDSAAMLL